MPVSVVAAARAELARPKAEQEAGLGESAATAAAESSDDDLSSSEDEGGPRGGQGMGVGEF